MIQRFFIRKIMSPVNTLVYRLSRGRMMAKTNDVPILLLTTTGRKSGRARTAPLLYREDGDSFIVVASFGGAPDHPAWYLNLESEPSASVQIGGADVSVRAETARGDERDRLWKLMTDGFPGFDAYKTKTTREIPVVALRRS